jgi:hypothetical protein
MRILIKELLLPLDLRSGGKILHHMIYLEICLRFMQMAYLV